MNIDQIIDFYHASRPRPVWRINKETLGSWRRLQDHAGGYLRQPNRNPADGDGTFLGIEICLKDAPGVTLEYHFQDGSIKEFRFNTPTAPSPAYMKQIVLQFKDGKTRELSIDSSLKAFYIPIRHENSFGRIEFRNSGWVNEAALEVWTPGGYQPVPASTAIFPDPPAAS